MNNDNPILNSSYLESEFHYATDTDASLNYRDLREGHRIVTPDINAIPSIQGSQGSMFEVMWLKSLSLHIDGTVVALDDVIYSHQVF